MAPPPSASALAAPSGPRRLASHLWGPSRRAGCRALQRHASQGRGAERATAAPRAAPAASPPAAQDPAHPAALLPAPPGSGSAGAPRRASPAVTGAGAGPAAAGRGGRCAAAGSRSACGGSPSGRRQEAERQEGACRASTGFCRNVSTGRVSAVLFIVTFGELPRVRLTRLSRNNSVFSEQLSLRS